MCLFLRKSSGQGPPLAFGKSARLGPESGAKNSQQRRGFQTGLRKQGPTSQVSRKKPRGPEHTPRIAVGCLFGRSGSPIWQSCLICLQIESRNTTPLQFKTKTVLYSVRIRNPLFRAKGILACPAGFPSSKLQQTDNARESGYHR